MFAVAHRTAAVAALNAELAAAGATVFEIDVQLGAGAPGREDVVVSHFIAFPGLRDRLHHDGWTWRRHAPALVDPPLAQVLAAVPGHAAVLLDPKETRPYRRRRLFDALAGHIAAPERVTVSTARVDDLDRYRAAGLRTWRTVGTRRQLAAVLAGDRLRDDGVTVRHGLIDHAVVTRLHRLVPTVVVWTVNDLARLEQLRRCGIDGVTTDSPAVARAAVARIGGPGRAAPA